MIPRDPNRKTIDPRELVKREGPQALGDFVSSVTPYHFQKRLLFDLCEALESDEQEPTLAEGVPGGGKTEAAIHLARACNLNMFILQGMEDLKIEDVLFSWSKKAGDDLLFTREQLALGEALAAYDYADRTGEIVLLVLDEVEKLPLEAHPYFYQAFQYGYATIPRLSDQHGRIGGNFTCVRPIVYATSNASRSVAAPFRSRCVNSVVYLPTPEEEIAILFSHVPEAPPSLVSSVVKITHEIRVNLKQIKHPPAMRESIALLKSAHRKGLTRLDRNALERLMGRYTRGSSDFVNMTNALTGLAAVAIRPHKTIDDRMEAYAGSFVRELEAVA